MMTGLSFGLVANSGKTALLVVDMLNPYEHDDADQLIQSVETIVNPLRELIARAKDEGTELIYVNDNYGDWKVSWQELADRALNGARPELVEPLLPPDDADFVMKARHTIFYMTPLEYLLGQKEIGHLVLTGQVTEQCIVYSALDAYVRHFEVSVPRDGVAHIHENLAEAAVTMMERNMNARVTTCADANLKGLSL
jgi:nicotinamidase-related amidase